MKVLYSANQIGDKVKEIKEISIKCGVMYDTARLLVCRGIDTVEKANKFLNPGKHNFNDPFKLSGMSEAVKRIIFARENKQNVLVFGDYDADGISATTVLYNCLKDFGMQSIRCVIPERDEGYGLSFEKITSICTDGFDVDLVISVDCGISDVETVQKLIDSNIDVIITDHHEPPEDLPNTIKINPKLKGQEYPFKELCGAGVAYKLGVALIGDKADDYLDFVALATVADSMELVDENRDIVFEGLKLFNSDKVRPAFKYLLGDTNKIVTAQSFAYLIAPRVNAGGRMGDAECALRLFMAKSEREIAETAEKLQQYNVLRQISCDEIYNQAKQQIKDEKLESDRIILVGNDSWKTGFVGIVASRLVEEYCRPVIVFAGHGDTLKGSARSVDGINIFEAINSAKDLLVAFGGHAQAAGVTVLKENFKALRQKLNDIMKDTCALPDKEKKVFAEWLVANEMSKRFAREIELLEPFGAGNKRPLFAVQEYELAPQPLKIGSNHYSFKTSAIDMLNFNGTQDVEILNLPIKKTLIFETNLSTFRGNEYLKGYLKHIICDYSDLKNIYLDIIENELNRALYCKTDFDLPVFEEKDKIGRVCFVASNELSLDSNSLIKNLPKMLYNGENSVLDDMVIISPRSLPDCVDTVVYLGRPFAINECSANCFIAPLTTDYRFIDAMKVDRSEFILVYNFLSKLVGKEYSSISSLYRKYKPQIGGEQFIFSASVFFELGIFYIKDGIIKRENSVMHPLENSKIFKAVKKIKEQS